MLKKVGILYHPRLEKARTLAEQLKEVIQQHKGQAWLSSAWGEEEARSLMPGTELVLSLGGDGTILRAARSVVPRPIPILGINLGRLGFMTELSASEAIESLPGFLNGGGWVEERAMLQAEILSPGRKPEEVFSYYALNDIVAGRGKLGRLVHIKARVDGELITTYRADGLIVATASGSTGYSLSAGGPILHPQSQELLLQPIAPHFCLATAIILPPTASVELEMVSDEHATASIDGQVDIPLNQCDIIRVKRSPYTARFLHAKPPTTFYRLVGQRLSGQPN
ncbi:MAG: ATP-NAD/AcoX kinase [Dehalococcoidia bacterium]|nr:ATP-NAD/AcoX kinase [Dehalococcoidia bacterium]